MKYSILHLVMRIDENFHIKIKILFFIEGNTEEFLSACRVK